MGKPLRVLFIEDSEDDTLLLLRVLRENEYETEHKRVDNEAGLKNALMDGKWDLIICDYSMPLFNGMTALQITKDMKVEIPFILISGSVGEETAVEAMRHGAQDYILKGRLTRFIPAIERELAEAKVRKARKIAEERLWETQRVLSTLLSNLPGMAYRCRCNESWTIDFVSDGCFGLTGHHASEAIGDSFANWIHPDDRERAMKSVQASVAAGRPFQLIYRLITANGDEKWIWSQGCLVRGASDCVDALEGFATDITERKRLEETQTLLEARLSQSQKMEALGRLAATVAHDFGNLLSVIKTTSELIAVGGPNMPFQKSLREISQATELGVGFIRQLQTFSHGQPEAFRTLNLNQVIASVEVLLRKSLGTVGLELVRDENLKSMVADSGQLVQVLMNLTVNARDAMPAGGKVWIETSMIELEEPNGAQDGNARRKAYVLLKVSDSGCGMDQSTLQHIFEPYFTTKSPEHGTGLGLAIVYNIVKSFGGFIEVESKLGKGTQFRIYFPAVEHIQAPALPALASNRTDPHR